MITSGVGGDVVGFGVLVPVDISVMVVREDVHMSVETNLWRVARGEPISVLVSVEAGSGYDVLTSKDVPVGEVGYACLLNSLWC